MQNAYGIRWGVGPTPLTESSVPLLRGGGGGLAAYGTLFRTRLMMASHATLLHGAACDAAPQARAAYMV